MKKPKKDEKEEGLLDEAVELLKEEEQKLPSGDETFTSEEKQTLKLLSELETETDHAFYLELLKKIVRSCRKFVESKRSEVPLRTLQTLDRHTKDITRHDVQRRYSKEAFFALGDTKAITLLIERLVTRIVYNPDDYAALFLALGDKAIPVLIADLATRKELKARRRVVDMLARFGEKVLPRIPPYLKDSRWYVVRNIVALLGEIKSESSVGSLRAALRHPEPRVRKETIKSLSAIHSTQALEYLIETLQDEDGEIATYCAFALGAMKEPGAVQSLLDAAQKTRHRGLQQEAISSLGKIGAQEAVPFLAQILRKWRLFRPESVERAQTSAAIALGEIGGPDALKALKNGTLSGNKATRDACWQALEIMDEGLGGV